MLSEIPLAARGPSQIIIFDIHALQERFYFTDQIIPRYNYIQLHSLSLCRLLTAIPYLINEIYKLPDANNLAIAFPDEGAHKRFHASFEQWPLITCIKKRNGDERHITVKEGITYYSLMF